MTSGYLYLTGIILGFLGGWIPTYLLISENIYKSGQVSVASGRYSCVIEGDVREDKTIETEWVCTRKELDND